MMYQIHEVPFTPELKKHIVDTLDKEAIESTGIDVFLNNLSFLKFKNKEFPQGTLLFKYFGDNFI